MQLVGKIALVTGGTRGIGAATAITLAQRGADVAIVGRNDDEVARQAKNQIEEAGGKCALIIADCGKPDDCRRAVAETVAQFGTIDVLVHSAGGPVAGGLMELTPEVWQAAFDVHVHAILHLSQAAVPHMRKAKEGAIVLVSSTAGIRGVAFNLAYQVVKGALPQFARALARELANDNIRVNCVAPGVIRTRFHDNMTEETKKNNLDNRIPLHREGKSQQVADVIALLAENDYMTGETIVVDGGLTMRIA